MSHQIDVIDQLLRERAPWFDRQERHFRGAQTVMKMALGYDKTVALAQELAQFDAPEIMDVMGNALSRNVSVEGLDNIPKTGPALIVANHPTGIADGVILHHILSPVRKDSYFFANRDILRVFPQMAPMICPVEWRHAYRSKQKTRNTLQFLQSACANGRLGIIFPSGRLAKRRGLRLYEREWVASAAGIARKFDLPVVPLHISARNSALFYILDFLHPTLRDITLFHETLNKGRFQFDIRIGPPITPQSLPQKPDVAIEVLKSKTLQLGGVRDTQDLSIPLGDRFKKDMRTRLALS